MQLKYDSYASSPNPQVQRVLERVENVWWEGRDKNLTNHHRHLLETESAIAPDIIAERGYFSAHTREDVPEVFKGYQRRPGLVIPLFSPDGVTVGCQLRADNPRRDRKGKVRKYENPKGSRAILDVLRSRRRRLLEGGEAVWLTEGVRKSDAISSTGRLAVTLQSVWQFQRDHELLSCWADIPLEGRTLYVVFDSDVTSKSGVQQALARLVEMMREAGARVLIVHLSDAPDGSKQGVDDYIAAGGSLEVLEEQARPFDLDELVRARTKKDKPLRRALMHLARLRRDMPMRTQGDFTDRDVFAAFVAEAHRTGRLTEDGNFLRVALSEREAAAAARVSKGTAGKSIKRLKEAKMLEREEGKLERGHRATYLLPTRALRGHYGREEGEGEDSPVSTTNPPHPSAHLTRAPLKADSYEESGVPTLQWGKVKRYKMRGARGNLEEHHEYLKRLGKKRAAIVEYLKESGGFAPTAELALVFGGPKMRVRDFRRRQLHDLMEPTAIVSIEGEFTVLSDDWELEVGRAMLLGEEYEDHEKRLQKFELERRKFKAWPNQQEAEPVPEMPPSEDLSKPWSRHPEGCACRACAKRFGPVIGEHVEGCHCRTCTSTRRGRPVEAVVWREDVRLPTNVSAATAASGNHADEGEDCDGSLGCECFSCSYIPRRYARPYGGAA
jgi:hypothetical protein